MNWYAVGAGVLTGLVTLCSTLLTVRASLRSNRRTEDNRGTEILQQAYQYADQIKNDAVTAMRADLTRLHADIDALRAELDQTKQALHQSEVRTARAERNVQTLRNLLIARNIPVPDLEGGNS